MYGLSKMTDYNKLTVKELQTLCKGKQEFRWNMRKDALVHLLSANGGTEAKIETKTHIKPKASVKVDMTKPKTISKEEAEKSADEWFGTGESLMRTWLINAILDPKQHRDIGKVLAPGAEIHVNKWLSEKSGRNIKTIVGVSYDGVTDDDKPRVRNQVKFRMFGGDWHLETTRRNSQKNQETNSTGHIAYKNDEFDVLAIFIPSRTFGITGSSIRCIPVSALINPSKPDQLIPRINATIRSLYDCDEKTEEVIKLLYQTPSLPQD